MATVDRKGDRSSDDTEGGRGQVPKYGAGESVVGDASSVKAEEVYAFDDSRKLGITSSVFLIINKMIGTGSEFSIYPPPRNWKVLTVQSFPLPLESSNPPDPSAFPSSSGSSAES